MNKITTIIIICVFILFSIILGAMSVGIYQISADSDAVRKACDTSSYFTKLIKESDDTSTLRTASIEGQIPALVMKVDAKEVWYFTYNSALRKIYSNEGDTISAANGEKVMDLESSDFVLLQENLLEITFSTQNGQETSMNIYLPDREGGAK